MTEWFEWRDAPPGDYAVLGDPIAHSLSPRLHAWAARAAGLEEIYRAIRVPKGELAEALERLISLGYRGVNCTVPLKEEACSLARGMSAELAELGAVNTLILPSLFGYNTDLYGFSYDLYEQNPGTRPVLILGSGGTARIVAKSFHRSRPFTIWARRDESLEWARAAGYQTTTEVQRSSDYGVIVNTTSAGHSGEAPPVIWIAAKRRGLAYDVNYGDASIPFLSEAKQADWRVRDGLGMLIMQAAHSRRVWFLDEPPLNVLQDVPTISGSMFCAVRPVSDKKYAWRAAVKGLKRGEVVVLPTETVLGLAADALSTEAVAKIFTIKGRPATNPLIVHVQNAAQAQGLTSEWPEVASVLAEKFWPGPLTLVLPKQPKVPDVTTGGLDTVALRVPNHPVALRFLADCARPLAAPSANLSGELSPTRIEHLNPVIREQVWAVLDGEASQIGIESTVVRVYDDDLVILRPGFITAEQLRQATGLPVRYAEGKESESSPGHLTRHYSPKARVHLVANGELQTPSITIGTHTPQLFARQLYGWLHEYDNLGESDVWIEMPPDTEDWRAVRDRLNRMVD
ncbi:MAG: threonylcarbamoyl-AMP synthase [Fimbriimonadaceae bacterium]|nr:threonylcarbamoyl-AMP synthase [Fimbriimonadaceae bacterium]